MEHPTKGRPSPAEEDALPAPLPFLLSVPHAGRRVPEEVRDLCRLTETEILEDGDGGAREIYGPLEAHVRAYLTTDVARAVVDLNRPEDDRGKDGAVKTHTCWDVPVWRRPLSPEAAEALVARHHRPYHGELRRLSRVAALGIDGHTMAAFGPPVGPDPGEERPRACVGDGAGACPRDWARALARRLEETLGPPVTVNRPFGGGFITRSRPGGIPWVQIELSRAPWATDAEKGAAVRAALRAFAGDLEALGSGDGP